MIIEVKGNLLLSDCDVIAHGCNCFHTMGAGIAYHIKKHFPQAYEADKKTEYGSKEKLGTFSKATENEKTIYNLYTQYSTAKLPGDCVVDYSALRRALVALSLDVGLEAKIGIPWIGCGLAGGDPLIVKDILESVFNGKTIYVYSL